MEREAKIPKASMGSACDLALSSLFQTRLQMVRPVPEGRPGGLTGPDLIPLVSR